MIYLLAGHTPTGSSIDPGAIGVNGVREADLTRQLRNAIAAHLREMKHQVWIDNDTHRLADVLRQVNSNEADVIVDLHFNAGPPTATGCEVIIPDRHTTHEFDVARKLTVMLANIMRIRNRGVKSERDTARGRIATLNQPKALNLLLEVCFITNQTDIMRYHENFGKIAYETALIASEAENLIK